jgi:hypothetical protein
VPAEPGVGGLAAGPLDRQRWPARRLRRMRSRPHGPGREEALVGTRVGKRAIKKTSEKCAHGPSFGSTWTGQHPISGEMLYGLLSSYRHGEHRGGRSRCASQRGCSSSVSVGPRLLRTFHTPFERLGNTSGDARRALAGPLSELSGMPASVGRGEHPKVRAWDQADRRMKAARFIAAPDLDHDEVRASALAREKEGRVRPSFSFTRSSRSSASTDG